MKFILGKKLNMTQIWKDDKVIGVTMVQAGPCLITQIKNKQKDGYGAAQIGFINKKEKNIKKPQRGHLKNLENFRYLREFRTEEKDLKKGDIINIDTFGTGDKINVTGISKGKGFQGVVKRYKFAGSKKTHGNKDQLRMPGSIGATGPAHVFKGQRMPGRMGNERNTITNLEIIEINEKNNTLLIKGAIPGAKNSLILISGKGELKIQTKNTAKDETKEEKNKKIEEDIKKNNIEKIKKEKSK